MTLELLLIGDVGDDVYHVGDEAMFETALVELASRCDARITAITSNPDVITARYGVAAIPHVGFDRRVGSAYDTDRERRLEAVLDGSAADAAAVSLRRAVERADGVLVCGGGNLSVSWPHLLYERVCLLALAQRRGIPTVLVGQTIGPTLTDRPAARLATAFGAARLVGVRDVPSAVIARQLAPEATVVHHEDDAAQLANGALPAGLPRDYVALTIHGSDDDEDLAERCDGLLAHLHHVTSLPVVLAPFTGTLDDALAPGTDAALAARLAKRWVDADWLRSVAVQQSSSSAAVVRHAAMVVSTRFHPLVFALSAGVPSVGFSTDRYTSIKLDGALAHRGLGQWRLPFTTIGTGIAEAVCEELWQRREEVRAHLTHDVAARRVRHAARWDVVAAYLTGADHRDVDLELATHPVALWPASVPTDVVRRWDERAHDLLDELALRADRSEEYALSLRDALEREIDARHQEQAAADRTHAALRAELAVARDDADLAERSAAAARELAGRLRSVVELGPGAAPRSNDVVALRRELDAIHRTKLFRWTAPARRLYARIRRTGGPADDVT